ncbi:prepilin-type N-terminal cleavage/methylation domain-containing protein [Ruminococcaceae bacterium YRB3002]|nr:prepilin-type N-terminal cleavage/methylation domain-containing protein [Ruminococcaceae bacterium YRB3002]
MMMVYKSKRGFTLLEMMLSIAIITIVSGCLVSLIVAIKDSYLSTYNSDDSADYAMLFAEGFENSFLAKAQGNDTTKKEWVWNVQKKKNSDNVEQDTLCCNNDPVFSLKQMSVTRKNESTPRAKWLIKMVYGWDSSSNVVSYTIYVIDNYYNPGHIKCVYNGGFAIPHLNDKDFHKGDITVTAADADHDGGAIKFKMS